MYKQQKVYAQTVLLSLRFRDENFFTPFPQGRYNYKPALDRSRSTRAYKPAYYKQALDRSRNT